MANKKGSPEAGYRNILEKYRDEGRFRIIPQSIRKAKAIDLGSNDYLGLGRDFKETCDDFLSSSPFPQFTASASRLLSGNQDYHLQLESKLSELYNKESLLFNSGYHANTGLISSLAIPSTLFLCDKLVHASIVDGLAIGKAEYRRWRHNDIASLETLIGRHYDSFDRIIIVVESVYSMDGDIAPVEELIAIKDRYPGVMLYVDEAHAFGVFGEKGLGVAEEKNIIDKIDIIVGTFGKAAASFGAFAVMSPVMKEFFINNARSFIFSTAIPPVICAWTLFMISKIVEMKQQREHLKEISRYFRNRVSSITGVENISRSQIIPLNIGNNADTLRISQELRKYDIIAPAIRRPTVPPGGERIRFSLNAGLTKEDIENIAAIIEKIYNGTSNEDGIHNQ